MKGVIVQVGEPKSIVLFNNGRIGAIPSPAGCHTGMVVTVKFNNGLKIVILSLAAVLLVALGAMIGAKFLGGGAGIPLPGPVAGVMPPRGHMGNMGNMGGGKRTQSTTVDQLKNLGDDTPVVLSGNIVQSLGDEKYIFRDSTGEIIVEIDRKIWRDLSLDVSDTVRISGEVDIEREQVIIDVKTIRKE